MCVSGLNGNNAAQPSAAQPGYSAQPTRRNRRMSVQQQQQQRVADGDNDGDSSARSHLCALNSIHAAPLTSRIASIYILFHFPFGAKSARDMANA